MSHFEMVYNMLLAELDDLRGDKEQATRKYLQLSKMSEDPNLAARATELALELSDWSSTQQASERWALLAPGDPEPRIILMSLGFQQQNQALVQTHLKGLLVNTPLSEFEVIAAWLLALNDGQALGAIEHMLKAWSSVPEQSVYSHYLLAQILHQDHRPNAAFVHTRALIQQGHFNAPVLLLHAHTLYESGQHQLCIAFTQAQLKHHPHLAELKLILANAFYEQGQHEAASLIFHELTEHPLYAGEAWLNLAEMALDANQVDTAKQWLLEAQYDPHFGDAARFYLGSIFEQERQLQAAMDWYRRIHIRPFYFPAQLRLALLRSNIGEHQRALNGLSQLHAMSIAEFQQLHLTFVEILLRTLQYQEALDLLDAALIEQPGDLELSYARANIILEMGNHALAENAFKAILAADPSHAHALAGLGKTISLFPSRQKEALAYLHHATTLAPQNPTVLESLAMARYHMGDHQQAIALFEQALDLQYSPSIAVHLGEVLWFSGQRESAGRLWREAVLHNPHDARLTRAIESLDEHFVP